MTDKILVVEDNPDNMKLVSWILEDEELPFAEAGSGEEALAQLENESFALVLLDISLPGIDGKETARRIRANPDWQNLPLIACTAHAIKQEEEQIWAAGVDAIVTKPIDERQLVEAIRKYLKSV